VLQVHTAQAQVAFALGEQATLDLAAQVQAGACSSCVKGAKQ